MRHCSGSRTECGHHRARVELHRERTVVEFVPMRMRARWLPIALLLAGITACCTNALAPPPGLTHDTRPKTRPKKRSRFKPPAGEAIEGKTVPVEGVGNAIVIGSPSPTAAVASPTPP